MNILCYKEREARGGGREKWEQEEQENNSYIVEEVVVVGKKKLNTAFWCSISFLKLKQRVSSPEAKTEVQYYKDISRLSRCDRCMDHTQTTVFQSIHVLVILIEVFKN